jgi:PAS domain S-box-containing protein
MRMGADGPHEGALVELLDAAPDGILLVGKDGRIAFANAAIARLFGYTAEELVGAPIETLVPEGERGRHVADRSAYANAPRRRPMGLGLALQGRRKDGSELPVEISLAPMTASDAGLVVAIVRDATEQRALEEQRLRFGRSQAVEEIVAGLEAIVWEATAPDRASLTYLGGRDEAFLGYSRNQWLREGFWLSVVYPDDRITALTFAETALEQDSFELEYRLVDAGGAIHDVRDIVSVTRGENREVERVRGMIVDLTHRRELEERLSESRKMEAVGQLAGGIAHDFNNLLTIVSGYALRLRRRADLSDVHADLDQIITAANRAAELTRQLLTFARRGQGEAVLLEPGETLTSLEPMLRRLIDADIAIDFGFDERLPWVLMDRAQLEQVAMNLIINASDAMHDGGTLTIAGRARSMSEADALRQGVRPGEYVQLSVTDTGVGIPPEVRERIFEPFFTTKKDKGTGMGLATVYGIVDGAGGWIDVDTAPGRGTTFHIMLPVAGVDAELVAEQPPGPTVLLVEDEKALRRLVQRMLEEEGHTVLAAADGLEAIAIAERHKGPLHLLLTDVVMPGLSGPELARRLHVARPDLEVLYMSGYNDSRLVKRGVEQAKVNLLTKPFTPDELVERVRSLVPPQDA